MFITICNNGSYSAINTKHISFIEETELCEGKYCVRIHMQDGVTLWSDDTLQQLLIKIEKGGK